MSSPPHKLEHLEDFTKLAWCNAILSDPSITKIHKRAVLPEQTGDAPNTFFTQTLFTDDAVRAYLSLYRPGRGRGNRTADAEAASDALLGNGEDAPRGERSRGDSAIEAEDQLYGDIEEPESLLLVSLGTGIDGGIRRLHGGITATILDQVMGILISYLHENTSATAELNVKYKKAITTPCVVLCRARITREAGRWIETAGWVEGWEDDEKGEGKRVVYAEGRGAFVKSRAGKI